MTAPEPTSKRPVRRALDAVPRILAHDLHILGLALLGLWLVAVPLLEPGVESRTPKPWTGRRESASTWRFA